MPAKFDLYGKRFGKLTVVGQATQKDAYNNHLWLCICDCGNETLKSYTRLKTRSVKSCGCLIYGRSKETVSNLPKRLFLEYQKGAKERNLIFDLTFERFSEIISENCFYCGTPPSNQYRGVKWTFLYSGIDRLDNGLGYTNENSVPCCKKCNFGKHKLSVAEFLQLVIKINKNLPSIQSKLNLELGS